MMEYGCQQVRVRKEVLVGEVMDRLFEL